MGEERRGFLAALFSWPFAGLLNMLRKPDSGSYVIPREMEVRLVGRGADDCTVDVQQYIDGQWRDLEITLLPRLQVPIRYIPVEERKSCLISADLMTSCEWCQADEPA